MESGVITGDIVGSTKFDHSNREVFLIALNKTIAEANQYFEPSEKIISQIFRGDSFQILLPKAEDALRLAILIRLGLILIKDTYTYTNINSKKPIEWDARVSVGIGSLDYINEDILLSDGEAFHNSGRAFDKLKKSRLTVRTPWEDLNEEFEVECFLADVIIKRLSGKQAEITYNFLLRKITQKKLAKELGLKPQNINKSLSYGGIALEEFIKRYETLIRRNGR